MKKFVILLTFIILFSLTIIGCTESDEAQNSNNTQNSGNQNISTSSNTNTQTQTWQSAYIEHLKKLPAPSDNLGYSTFGMRDLDKNGIPELLIIQQDSNALNAILTVYSYDSDIYKIGDYSNPKKLFLGGFRFSNNPDIPGLFECWWGSGVEHYGYIYVKDRKLFYEYLYYDDRTAEPPHRGRNI